jgi:quercetin dioxygenase-like cupin family protein
VPENRGFSRSCGLRNTWSRTASSSVAFDPKARTWWHSHPRGQTLLVTDGDGWIQCDGEQRRGIHKGDVIWIPPDVRHWHGAQSDKPMTHIAIQEKDDHGQDSFWDKEVTDQEYRA